MEIPKTILEIDIGLIFRLLSCFYQNKIIPFAKIFHWSLILNKKKIMASENLLSIELNAQELQQIDRALSDL